MSSPGACFSAGSCGGAAEAMLRGIVPPGMACCLDALAALTEPLHATETPGMERMAPVRLREFVAGRTAARRAICLLTGTGAPVPRNADRSPAWPAGLCGSLSHSRRYAIAVVARLAHYQAIGVDIEEDSRLGKALWGQIMTQAEAAFLGSLPMPRAVQTATLLFSAKEAYYKCLSRLVHEQGRWPEPDSIQTSVDFDAATLACSVTREKRLPVAEGRFASFDRHWITLLHIKGGSVA